MNDVTDTTITVRDAIDRDVSMLAYEQCPKMTTVNLREIRERPVPGIGWKPGTWERSCRETCRARVFAMFAAQQFFDDVGWIEHTGSWDWGIDVTMMNGDEASHVWGSQIEGIEIGGKLYTTPATCRNHLFDAEGEVILVVSSAGTFKGDDADEDFNDDQMLVRYRIDDIAKLTTWFDT